MSSDANYTIQFRSVPRHFAAIVTCVTRVVIPDRLEPPYYTPSSVLETGVAVFGMNSLS